jgi:hypothetical protein
LLEKKKKKKKRRKKGKKKKNLFSLITIDRISTLPLIQVRCSHNTQEKKVSDISNADFFRYSQYDKPIGI